MVMKDLFDWIAENKAWIKTEDKLPEEGLIVETKVQDEDDCRNVTKLKRYRNCGFLQTEACMSIIHRLIGGMCNE